MAVTAAGSGTQTATVNTEHTLLDVAVAGVFSLYVDPVNMAAGDVVELRVYAITLTGGVRRVAYKTVLADAQATDGMLNISVPTMNELTDAGSVRYTLKQTAGTGRAFTWKVLQA